MSSSLVGVTPVWIAFFGGVLGIAFVAYLISGIMKKSRGSKNMEEISDMINTGAIAFLTREYKTIAVLLFFLSVIIFFAIAKKTAFAFLAGAFCSIAAGYIGMQVATRSNARAAQAASVSFNDAMGIAFPGGMVMGLSVVGLGLIGLTTVYHIILWHVGLVQENFIKQIIESTQLIVGFSMGASVVALFGRVGGGIYTKAADMGADIVGKVEAGIPEDDPRNPAVIADNVGDNVGDVAGMGADLFESYVGAIISAMVIASLSRDVIGTMLTFLLVTWGVVSSIIGFLFVRVSRNGDPQRGLRRGVVVSAISLIVGDFFIVRFWYIGWEGWRLLFLNMNVFWAVLAGLAAGMVVGYTAEIFTSGKRVQDIAESSKTGPATNILSGFSCGMFSTVLPMFVISIAIIIAFHFAHIYGIALAAIGMLSITGIIVAVDAYGPIADNAAGIAEMAHMGKEVRERTERLDAVGNTTAAVGKGFAIASAALTALALFAAYAKTVALRSIDILSAEVVAGLFIGGVIPFFFTASTIRAVSRTAFKIVQEVRRQFKEIPGLIEGKARPDSARCVDITTQGALQEMIIPGFSALIIPLLVGIILGVEALGGFLAGSIITGVPMAIFLANAGGAWDNAKKYIEQGNMGGKGSEVHKTAVIGDTVGDPFKDTSGPSLNILLKLMAIVSLLFSKTIYNIHEWLVDLVVLYFGR